MLSKTPTSFEQLGICGSINNISYHLLNVYYVSNILLCTHYSISSSCQLQNVYYLHFMDEECEAQSN